MVAQSESPIEEVGVGGIGWFASGVSYLSCLELANSRGTVPRGSARPRCQSIRT